jgi:hypothetical protein
MKTVLRLGVTAAAGALALALSSSAFAAAISPKLIVSAGGPTLTINTSDMSSVSGDPVAKIQTYVPTGFGLKSPAVGTTLGTAKSRALVKDIDPSLETILSGDVVAISSTDPAVAYESANCDNGPHQAVWMVRLTGQQPQISQPINVPIFVDATSGTETQFGAYKLVACMRSPDPLPGTANRSPLGTKFDSIEVTVKGFTVPKKAGDYRWRSLWTPFTPGSATMNTAGNAEAQSIVKAPIGVLTLTAAKASGGRVALSGTLLVGTEPAKAVRIALTHGAAKANLVSLGTVKTNGVGKYLKLTQATKSLYYQAGATVVGHDIGTGFCQASFGTGVPCTDATIGTAHILSAYVRFKR